MSVTALYISTYPLNPLQTWESDRVDLDPYFHQRKIEFPIIPLWNLLLLGIEVP
jgi:hypothetical protein